MRFIQKVNIPQFFIDDTAELMQWDNYYANKKRNLKEHILKEEQNSLCIYCESKVSITSSHLEHIKPKHLDVQNLTFNYHNIAVSCNGTCHNNDADNTNYHCGHRKDRIDTSFEETKFLNPVEILNIREYFKYDYDNYLISPSNKNIQKAQYMINTLHLNDSGLPKAREKALQNFIKKIKKISNIEARKEKIQQVLNQENIAFISFLKFKYSKV